MSMTGAFKYIEKMKTDNSFWLMHSSISDKKERKTLIKEAGFNFSDEELQRALKQMLKEILTGGACRKKPS
ncbi:MAG: Nif11 domain [Bacteroidota bacterium]|nr:Nif11 domain [Bacteroidota bacterium]